MKSIWIALTYIKGLGPKRIKKVYIEFPHLTFADFKGPNLEKIKKIIGNKKVSETLSDIELIAQYTKKAEETIRLHEKNDISVVTIADNNYPELLKKIDDSPIVLYCKGDVDLLQQSKSIAVVGTRHPTAKGEGMARRIAKIFSEKGYVIVSGLALGIDTEAHKGTLEVNGKTVAVLANGLDTITPKENKKLAEEIVQKGGLLISEYPIRTKTFRAAFVQRDRIQSGLSIAVCPVQTDIKGGTQHTIKFARSQNRLLFCPTPLEQVPATRGIEALLKEDALPIRNSHDIVIVENSISKRLQELTNSEEIPVKLEQTSVVQLDLFD
ncbi:DNA-protecting protein DprA [Aquibacillus halophilus]|uniref:DNA-protecting protein DprA n=1 Tax=Aquibacillus halophilus TaxID=930132 RepID=A0A6A8DCP7_9BACI|nr:DNA-processing protein DprA [Aquibacillus halophilus]MRH41649.1 DNA-protecting protein DprA [Aquibacillus halophilus]